MTPKTLRSALLRALGAALLVLLFAAPPAEARTRRTFGDVLIIRPSDLDDDPNFISNALGVTATKTYILKRGRYVLGGSVLLFNRSDGVTICGQTGRAGDVVIETAAPFAMFIDHCENVLIRDLTLRSTSTVGEAIRLSGFVAVGADVADSFADDVTVSGCALEADTCIRATERVNRLTVSKSTLRVSDDNGFGILWQDGSDLFVSGNRFRTSNNAAATAAVRVLGPLSIASNGQRAKTIVLSNNRVSGDFTYGFDLVDTTDVRIRRNRVSFPGPVQGGSGGTARIGFRIRRFSAADLPDNIELFRNRVRRGLFGAWMEQVAQSRLLRNDFRRNGSSDALNSLSLNGGAVLVTTLGGACRTLTQRNDFRNLRSPNTVPAVVEQNGLSLSGDDCFPEDHRNRVDRNRPVFTGETQQ